MGRPARIEFVGAIFHIWARRVDRWPLFVDEVDYRRYVRLLELTVGRFDWIVLSFCLMPNHVHLVVELRDTNLAAGMHWLHGMYVRRFNDRHGREGHLFERRYNAKLIQDEIYFATVVQYIEQNPVKASLCSSPDEWPWSSRGIIAAGPCPKWLAHDVLLERRGALANKT